VLHKAEYNQCTFGFWFQRCSSNGFLYNAGTRSCLLYDL